MSGGGGSGGSGGAGGRRVRQIGILANGAVESRGDLMEGSRGMRGNARSGIIVNDGGAGLRR